MLRNGYDNIALGPFGDSGEIYEVVSKDLVIEQGVKLSILPGTSLYFKENCGIVVKGTLNVINDYATYNTNFAPALTQ